MDTGNGDTCQHGEALAVGGDGGGMPLTAEERRRSAVATQSGIERMRGAGYGGTCSPRRVGLSCVLNLAVPPCASKGPTLLPYANRWTEGSKRRCKSPRRPGRKVSSRGRGLT